MSCLREEGPGFRNSQCEGPGWHMPESLRDLRWESSIVAPSSLVHVGFASPRPSGPAGQRQPLSHRLRDVPRTGTHGGGHCQHEAEMEEATHA